MFVICICGMKFEEQKGKGSEYVFSIDRMYLIELASTQDHIVMYSVAYVEVNRNIKLSLTLLQLAQNHKIQAGTFDLQFLVTGHSYLSNDRVHGVIKRTSKKKKIILFLFM